jgi:hypothetical protein
MFVVIVVMVGEALLAPDMTDSEPGWPGPGSSPMTADRGAGR